MSDQLGQGRSIIVADRLTRVYRVQKKAPGLLASVKALVHRTYTEVRAVDEVSVTIGRGELVGFLGPNGAGKTTTLKMMAGLLEPTGGQVRVLGHEPFRRESAFQRRFALVLGQKNQLWWDLPANESFLLNKEIYGISDAAYRETLDELADLLDLRPLLDVQVRKLSLGERMKCELAAALLHQPDVLFLDEPTIGLDVVMQQKIREFIATYRERHQATILLTSHYMDDVNTSCVEVRTDSGELLIFDGGTGARELGLALAKAGPVRAHVFIGHTHADHLFQFAWVARVDGQLDRATRLLGAAENVREIGGRLAVAANRQELDDELALLRNQLDEATFAAAWAEGRVMSVDQAAAYALELLIFARESKGHSRTRERRPG